MSQYTICKTAAPTYLEVKSRNQIISGINAAFFTVKWALFSMDKTHTAIKANLPIPLLIYISCAVGVIVKETISLALIKLLTMMLYLVSTPLSLVGGFHET